MRFWRIEGRDPTQAQRLFRGLLREWLVVGLLLLSLTAVLSLSRNLAFSHFLYDRLSRLNVLAVDPRILLVTIDDRSLEALGRWPWPREVHAKLLDRLAEAPPLGVLFDVIFDEPERSGEGDERLAKALCGAGNVVLPLLREGVPRFATQLREIGPIEPLRRCARAVGHINVEADSDGVVRGVFLREGPVGQPRGQLAWLAYQMALPVGERQSMPGVAGPVEAHGWQRQNEILLPFVGAAGSFPSVPYISVLRGEVPPQLLRDRLILVGATAPGLGDRYVTPVSEQAGTTAGVEIQANLLNGLLQQRSIVELTALSSLLLSVSAVALLLGGLLLCARHALWLTLACMVTVLAGAWGLLRLGLWWSPAASLSGFLLAYLIWNWRRLSAVLAYFGWELARLNEEPVILPERHRSSMPKGDVLQGRIAALEQALGRTRDTRRFIADGLECLPVATLISDIRGQVLLANRSARKLLGSALVGEDWIDVLARLGFPGMNGPESPVLSALVSQEFRDSRQRTLHLDLAPLRSAQDEVAIGWLFSLADLTLEREAEQQRAALLRFLSHDLRAPHSAILALLDVQREQHCDTPLHRQIEQQVRRALGLTEAFVHLAKAESEAYRFQPVLFAMLVLDAFDQVAPLAQLKGIELRHQLGEADESLVCADAALLTRALFNLLENAIKYSPSGTFVSLDLKVTDNQLACSISDQGSGISAVELPCIFDPYRRFTSAHDTEGLGLGMAMVKAVIDRHDGCIRCDSLEGRGTTFTLCLPLWVDAADQNPGEVAETKGETRQDHAVTGRYNNDVRKHR
ncbi:CHASE2 domain-containing protein [Pseudomonas agarici]|uniref:CHASE2 domain-containing protein n=1 Tax=Pseudomonas agarici TaxID=46677 RepID=UPI0002E64A29|nr:CHASE2 domain-containing protein [Pseudomonas agarici]NWC11416.1 CHASE2 domain-containing protein [Pseudomonas agarici]SEL70282.1 sensor domain CHASE2-containing protein [Pseudomonas agarici]